MGDSFDVDQYKISLETCHQNDCDMKSYLASFSELVNFFNLLGTVFHFVTSDVTDKVRILNQYLREQPDYYRSIPSMVEYEVKNDLTELRNKPSGCRTLLRLHRALEFVQDFFKKLANSDESEKASHLASTSYHETLAKYHPWLIRKTASLGMLTLPSRHRLLEMLHATNDEEVKLLLQKLDQTADVIVVVREATQKLYVDNNLLDLK